ncbi:MAG TPA: hypothetical protein VGK34_07365 [Armatimonadota bacterium]
MNLFDGLYLYEIVLLVLGTIFFVVITSILIYLVLNRRSYKGLTVLFIFPIVMIGYPSIKSIEYNDGVIKIEKTTTALQSNPSDPVLRQQLSQAVGQVSARPISNPRDLAVIGEAQYALGNEDAANQSAKKALELDPSSTAARALQHKIEIVNSLTRLSSAVQANPADPAPRRQLKESLAEVSQLPIANPVALTTVAQAQSTVGDHQKALATVNTALKINPSLSNAVQVRGAIENKIAASSPH